MHLTFSPPDKTLAFFKASSPENNTLPNHPLKSCSYTVPSVNCLNQSTSDNSQSLKYFELSLGK